MSSIKLSIAEPCHENWNAMLPEEKGRFCLSCQKTVVDFTNMSDRQVVDYFKNYQGNTCGQFSNDQLERELTKPKTHSIGRWKYFWQILLPAFFAFQKVAAQPATRGKVSATQTCEPIKPKPYTMLMGMVVRQPAAKPATIIHGKIVNDKSQPVSFATVTSSDGKYAVADSIGQFKIVLADKAVLSISHVGYNQKNFTIDSLQTNSIAGLKFENGQVVIETLIELKPAEVAIPNVVVVGYEETNRLTCVLGSTTIVSSKTFFTKEKVIKPNNELPQLKIFPNPIQPGQNFQIAIQVKKTGNYLLQITDAGGKMIMEEKLTLPSKIQTETINGNILRQAGIYFLRLANPADKKDKVLNGRIVVQ